MEGGKQTGSSITSAHFDPKDPAADASSGIFGAIFAPPAKVLGRESLQSFEAAKTFEYFNQDLNAKPAVPAPEKKSPGTECQCKGQSRRSLDCLLFLPEEKVKPFPYSSSIYYGGQDFYVNPESTSEALTTFTEDVGEDYSGSATRGNWWQGSLYY